MSHSTNRTRVPALAALVVAGGLAAGGTGAVEARRGAEEPSEPPATEASQPALATLPNAERLVYRWRLQGLAGFIARLFVPGRGEGLLETRPVGEGRLQTELRITSTKAGEEEYWIYGATIDPEGDRTLSAWNESHFRGREKRRAADLEGDEILDVPSGIRFLRRARPASPVRRRLWTDGKVYPVEFRREGRESRQVGGRTVVADLYTVRGVKVEGERYWDGGLDVWMSTGEPPTPLEILYRSGRGRVDLELVEPDGD